jgi:hypothetical protein
MMRKSRNTPGYIGPRGDLFRASEVPVLGQIRLTLYLAALYGLAAGNIADAQGSEGRPFARDPRLLVCDHLRIV